MEARGGERGDGGGVGVGVSALSGMVAPGLKSMSDVIPAPPAAAPAVTLDFSTALTRAMVPEGMPRARAASPERRRRSPSSFKGWVTITVIVALFSRLVTSTKVLGGNAFDAA